MIQLTDKKLCCGCSACVQICPKQCISFAGDNEGFGYPLVDSTHCINCGLCEKVCPFINNSNPRIPVTCYAAINQNEDIRKKSSSGGVFTYLAEYVINQGGVVFGAGFNDQWEVIHTYTESMEGLVNFRGSKYVQSSTGNTFKEAKAFLDSGRQVLYSGTPCQIAGLKRFLRKKYDNLLTVDIVCHGVPSPMVWKEYLRERLLKKRQNFKNLNRVEFRNKDKGWNEFSMKMIFDRSIVYSKTLRQDPFLKGFLKNLYLRPSCYECKLKSFRSNSDVTIADFWGISNVLPDFDDDKGTSLVCCNTVRMNDLIHNSPLRIAEVGYDDAVTYNPAIEKSVCRNECSGKFYNSLKQNTSIEKLIEDNTNEPLALRILRAIKRYGRRL